MKRSKLVFALLGGAFVVVVVVFMRSPPRMNKSIVAIQDAPKATNILNVPVTLTNTARAANARSKIRKRASEFSDEEKRQFSADFEKTYRPRILNWCSNYDGRVPFSPDEISADKLAERFSNGSAYSEYVFVVDGITVGLRESKDAVRVDYLNDPKQTRKMAELPNTGEPPIVSNPIDRAEIARLLEAEGGKRFSPFDIRMKQSGFSGGLNGGVLVSIGGDPKNEASHEYDLVFGPDGKLAYYLRGR